MRAHIIILTNIALLVTGCLVEEKPTGWDGEGILEIYLVWESFTPDGESEMLTVSNAEVQATSEYGTFTSKTDEVGRAEFKNLPTSTYIVSARSVHPLDSLILLVGSMENISVLSGNQYVDTLTVLPMPQSGIMINEIYTAGPVNDIFYVFDQFIEIYNASNETKYLDGIWIMRLSRIEGDIYPGEDGYNDGQVQGVTYAFAFPGRPGERNHPIEPGQFMVLASTAVDHTQFVAGSYDLSNADWEFYNQYSAVAIDNPDVPNITNMLPHRTSRFLLALTNDRVIMATGEDTVWVDGIRIDTIIDGVEYQSNPPPRNRKTLDPRVDRGYVLSPPRYSGMSMQRRLPGFDTNDSRVDFEILPRATPGYQK